MWLNEFLFWLHYLMPISPTHWDDGSNTVVFSNQYIKIRLFPAKGRRKSVCKVFYPPFAGRDGTVCNYLIGLYQRLGFDVYVFDLLPAHWLNNAVSLEMLVGLAKICIQQIKDRPYDIVGVCMGGWLSLLAVKGERKPRKHTIIATPIDTTKGDGVMMKMLKETPFALLILPVLMTGVNPAWLQWWRFTLAYNPVAVFLGEPLKLYRAIIDSDQKGISKYHRNRNWYYNPRPLAWWFLEAVDKIFRKNMLKEMIGEEYDWPFYIYAGKEDEITPWEQTVALVDIVKKAIAKVFPRGGHTITFNGDEQLAQIERDEIEFDDELDLVA